MKINIFDSHISIEALAKYGAGDIFVETGTYNGDTLAMILSHQTAFKKIYSVELDQSYFERAVQRFAQFPNVNIWKDDSPDFIRKVFDCESSVAEMTFWLDAHASGPLPGGASGGTPVLDELRAIQASEINTHTIFIDDRRLFGSAEWDQVTEDDAMAIIQEINPQYKIHHLDGHVKGDVICATVRG